MNPRLVCRALVAGALCVASISAGPAQASASPGVLATFEGHAINLSQGWGEARACSVDQGGITCYRTEQLMDQAHRSSPGLAAAAPSSATLSCSTSLRLYDGVSFGAPVLQISSQGALVTLSSVGFDNVTSSYKVGACTSHLYSGLQTGLYPGSTSANAQSASMLSGWDNTISSVVMP